MASKYELRVTSNRVVKNSEEQVAKPHWALIQFSILILSLENGLAFELKGYIFKLFLRESQSYPRPIQRNTKITNTSEFHVEFEFV